MSAPREPDTKTLIRAAEQLAVQRREAVTSVHLLAAMLNAPCRTAKLLEERQVTQGGLFAVCDPKRQPEALRDFQQRSREIGQRMGVSRTFGVHLLLAILNDSTSAGRGALVRLGVNVTRLRTAALQVGLGLVSVRRALVSQVELGTKTLHAAKAPAGVAIPVFPPPSQEAKRMHPAGSPTRGAPPKPLNKPESAADRSDSSKDLKHAPPKPCSKQEKVGELGEATPSAQPHQKRKPPALRTDGNGRDRDSPFSLAPQDHPILCEFGKNLTHLAVHGELDEVVGRDLEMEQILDVLAKRHANNPLLLGPAGVGKTSLVRGLAQRIVCHDDFATLDSRVIVEVPVSEFIAGTAVRGTLAQRMAGLRKEVARAGGRVVVFFDEIELLFSADFKDELGAELKLALALGELPIIGATTFEQYKKTIEPDAALARRFSVIEVGEPSIEETYLMLDVAAKKLGRHHNLSYTEAALALSIAWSKRYLPGSALPDKALSIIDLAGARARRRGALQVEPEAVAEVIATMAEVPKARLLETDGERMLRLEEILAARVIGHDEPIRKICRILRRNAAGLCGRRPIGTFLLLGPTGVGKTETAKAIAEVLFHNEQAMTRIDLSEYSEAHSVAKLIGAPPGYIGHESGGQLTEAVRRRPYQVILLDEVEKAHPEVLTSFLAVFDEGRMTDGRGRQVDFCNTVILMTSNIGSKLCGKNSKQQLGFGAAARTTSSLPGSIISAARSQLAPELYNRIDEVLVFLPLPRSEVRQIAALMLEGQKQRLEQERSISLEFSDELLDYLLEHGGFDPDLGARPMRRTLARLIEAPLAERILRQEIAAGDTVRLSVGPDGVHFIVKAADSADLDPSNPAVSAAE